MDQHLEVPEDAHPTIAKPIHGERRPAFTPFLITVALIVLILIVMLAVFLL